MSSHGRHDSHSGITALHMHTYMPHGSLMLNISKRVHCTLTSAAWQYLHHHEVYCPQGRNVSIAINGNHKESGSYSKLVSLICDQCRFRGTGIETDCTSLYKTNAANNYQKAVKFVTMCIIFTIILMAVICYSPLNAKQLTPLVDCDGPSKFWHHKMSQEQ